MPVSKNWNYCAFIIGPPGYGKTTIAKAIVRRHLSEGGVVFVHDPVAQYAKDGCHFYKNVDAWRAAARAGGKGSPAAMPRGASLGGSAEDITKLALEMGEKVNRADNVRVPILVVYDEASLLDGSGSTWVGRTDNEMLATRRHRGVGLVFNLQDSGQLTERFYRMSTNTYVMAQTTESTIKLERALMLEKNTLIRAGVPNLREHQYLHVKLRVGVVPEAL